MEKFMWVSSGTEIQVVDMMVKTQDKIKMAKIQKEVEENNIHERIKEIKVEYIIKESGIERTMLEKCKERDGLRRLVDDRFIGNMTTCARVMRVSTSTVSRVVSGETRMGGRLLRGIIGYFEKNGLEYSEYFSFK